MSETSLIIQPSTVSLLSVNGVAGMFVHFPRFLQENSRLLHTLLKTKQLHALIMKVHRINDPFYAIRIVYSLRSEWWIELCPQGVRL